MKNSKLKKSELKIGKADNFLDLIPLRKADLDWRRDEEGLVSIYIERKSWLERLLRRFRHIPDQMRIDLDQVGSAVFAAMDGGRTIGEICAGLQREFGESVEPVYERVGTYINILRNNGFIELQK